MLIGANSVYIQVEIESNKNISMLRTFLSLIICIFGLPSMAQTLINNSSWITDLAYAKSVPEKVYKLDLSNQNLREVPKAIKQFVNLQELKLSDNKIISINGAFDGLKNIEFVELSGNWIQNINFMVFEDSKHRLAEIYIRENQLKKIDSSINILTRLELLNAGGNKIENIDDDIKLPYLVSVYLDNNLISGDLSFLSASKSLRRLNLNNNRFSEINIDHHFINLIRLDIGDNPIEKLEFSDHRLKMEKLILDWINLSNIDLGQFPPRLIRLSMEHCSLDSAPKIVYNLRQLRELSIMHNDVIELQDELLNMKSLKRLWIAGNPIDHQKLTIAKKKRRLIIHMEEGDIK